MCDRSMRSGTELAREIKLTDWSMAGNLSNWSSGVQTPRDICTRLKRYLYSAKCSWIIIHNTECFPLCSASQITVLTQHAHAYSNVFIISALSSWSVLRSPLDQTVQARAEIMVFSWAILFTPKVPLSTQVCKWVLAN